MQKGHMRYQRVLIYTPRSTLSSGQSRVMRAIQPARRGAMGTCWQRQSREELIGPGPAGGVAHAATLSRTVALPAGNQRR